MLPELEDFCNVILLRWLVIGHALAELVDIWKNNKHDIKEYTRIDEWLPAVVKQRLSPSLLHASSWNQLRKYVILYENRYIVTELPKIRGEQTHRLNELIRWLSEFNAGVQHMCNERKIIKLNDDNERILLYKEYLEFHDDGVSQDSDQNRCDTIEYIIREENKDNNDCDMDSDNDIFNADINTQNDMDNSDSESGSEILDERDRKILKLKQQIKDLKNELKIVKKDLKQSRFQCCKTIRELHIYKTDVMTQWQSDYRKILNENTTYKREILILEKENNKLKSDTTHAMNNFAVVLKALQCIRSQNDNNQYPNSISSINSQSSNNSQSSDQLTNYNSDKENMADIEDNEDISMNNNNIQSNINISDNNINDIKQNNDEVQPSKSNIRTRSRRRRNRNKWNNNSNPIKTKQRYFMIKQNKFKKNIQKQNNLQQTVLKLLKQDKIKQQKYIEMKSKNQRLAQNL